MNIIRPTRGAITATALAAAAIAVLMPLAPAMAGSLENLERERAIRIQDMLNPALTPDARAERQVAGERRLVDFERMVINDRDLVGRNTPVVRVAFRNYDLTFMVHAAVEKGITLTDNWLEQIGVSTASLKTTRVGRRW